MLTAEQRDEIGNACPECKVILNGEKIRGQLKAFFRMARYKLIPMPSPKFDRAQRALSEALELVGQAAMVAGVFKPFASHTDALQGFYQAIEYLRLTVSNICEKAEPGSGLPPDKAMEIVGLFNQCEDGLDQASFEIATAN
jgi:hypothetical protein